MKTDDKPVVETPAKTTEPLPSLEERVAVVAYEAKRAYCLTIGDDSKPAWPKACNWERETAVKLVKYVQDHPDARAVHLHDQWAVLKDADGWKLGAEKDATKKTHPGLTAYDKLEKPMQAKAALSVAVIKALLRSLACLLLIGLAGCFTGCANYLDKRPVLLGHDTNGVPVVGYHTTKADVFAKSAQASNFKASTKDGQYDRKVSIGSISGEESQMPQWLFDMVLRGFQSSPYGGNGSGGGAMGLPQPAQREIVLTNTVVYVIYTNGPAVAVPKATTPTP